MGVPQGHRQNLTEFVDPFIDPALTHRKHRGHDFLQGRDFVIDENKQQCLFHGSQTSFSSTTHTSSTRCLVPMSLINIGMPRHGKGGQQGCELGLIQTREGTECTGRVFEILREEHGGYLQPVVLDFALGAYSLLYHLYLSLFRIMSNDALLRIINSG